jgi:signal peptidase I
MSPTLQSGGIALVSKMAYLWHEPSRGDIVAVWNGRELMVKRVVGLPGERISARAGMFFINGSAMQEPYVRCHNAWNLGPGKMTDSNFVVAGDNRAETIVAVVARGRIVGRLVY